MHKKSFGPGECRIDHRKLGWMLLVIVFAIIVGILATGPGIVFALENRPVPAQTESDPGTGIVFRFWKFLSGADGDRCSMHPTCSGYAHEAFHKHGLVKGWVMTCDRLIRCGRDETRISPEIWLGGKKRTLDPVDGNDHWPRP